MTLTPEQKRQFLEVAESVGAPPDSLYALIQFESGWDPSAANPRSSARGLMQWIDARARDLGYAGSEELVAENPTIEEQLSIIEQDLSRYGPFDGDQDLFMAVFYPAARNWPADREFPEHVQAVNPGITTPADYVNFVWSRVGDVPQWVSIGGLLLALAAIGIIIIISRDRRA